MKPARRAKGRAVVYGYDQVIIFARKVGPDGMENLTTYGVDEGHCGVAARIGNYLKYEIMKWTKQ